MNLLSTGEDYELAAAVGRELDVDRQIRMLNRLEPEKAARLAAHYPPERIARIMEKTDDRKLIAIAVLLSPETMGHASGALNSRNMDRFINLVSREQILAALPHIDLERFKKDWPELAPGTQNILRDIGNDYPPLAEAILSIE
jgi:hypothetical protein